ncbi:hypothetical protein GCM10020367_39740 [Streptomyces sannanensis]|uniref:Lipoprotein n=1 Tax=Streptomyces sannanensis TaxID=285536 RepID=A0ABP6SEP9_9ACTN
MTTKKLAALLGTAALGVLGLAGCGIRSTGVPVDAGAAPSRVSCEVPRDGTTASSDRISVRVRLVCGSQLVQVERRVPAPEGGDTDRVRLARTLLHELRRETPATEKAAGVSTDVPAGLQVTAGREGDPEGTLRLSKDPGDLPAFALSQIICTYAEGGSTATADGTVLLAGPGNAAPPRLHVHAHPPVPPRRHPGGIDHGHGRHLRHEGRRGGRARPPEPAQPLRAGTPAHSAEGAHSSPS